MVSCGANLHRYVRPRQLVPRCTHERTYRCSSRFNFAVADYFGLAIIARPKLELDLTPLVAHLASAPCFTE